ncbi:MAG: hypothetical protein C3F08_06915 [Candidatus Methylomirabilota bacterium]|nr:MAG: hypothetical protein C3F08_06915 [candidate division NC10 bacterium]
MGSVAVKALVHQKKCTKLVVVACLAIALCMMPCGAVEHHASMGTPSILCIVDLPRVFRLVIVMNMLLVALSPLTMAAQASAFSLLKPPRSRFAVA